MVNARQSEFLSSVLRRIAPQSSGLAREIRLRLLTTAEREHLVDVLGNELIANGIGTTGEVTEYGEQLEEAIALVVRHTDESK